MFSIILPVYDGTDRLVDAKIITKLVDGVLALRGERELIVVNNNGPDVRKLSAYLRERASDGKITLVEAGENRGTSGGFNLGLKYIDARSEFCVFLSGDAEVVDNEMLVRIRRIFEGNPKLGVGHPYSVLEDSDEYNISREYGIGAFRRAVKEGLNEEEVEPSSEMVSRFVDKVWGLGGVEQPRPSFPLTFAVIRRSLIDELGGFDEGVEFACHENDDFAYRALTAGYQVGRLNGVFVNHRRLTVRNLGITDQDDRKRLPHSRELKQSSDWWETKYGVPYDELYFGWRYGKLMGKCCAPIFVAKRLARKWIGRISGD